MNELIDDPPEFTDDQLRASLKQMGEEARQKAFAAGLPVMVIEDGNLVLVYADGTKEIKGPVSLSAPIPDFSKNNGLLPAIAQDVASGQVLMLAWMNAEAYAETVRTGRAVYFSRSRGKLWRKGEESGHVQHVKGLYVDCDADTILLQVEQVGAACHEGYQTCFFRQVTPERVEIVAERLVDPAEVYGPK